jgi:hypothetical protein
MLHKPEATCLWWWKKRGRGQTAVAAGLLGTAVALIVLYLGLRKRTLRQLLE